jgi:ABC-type multidrug transport system permease subunit
VKASLRTIGALIRRALNELVRVPGAAIPGVLAPTIFMLGLSSVFGHADQLRGFTADDFRTYIVPVGLLQGAGFTGAATGVNLARDIEQGWFDRLLLCPAPRVTVLLGIVGSATLRGLLPGTFLFCVAMILGVPFPGVGGLLLAILLIAGLASAMAFYSVTIALRFRTQQAAPLMQIASFSAILFTTAYAPKPLLTDWLRAIATVNPVNYVLEGVRQGFVADVTWADTWPALLAIGAMLVVFGTFATRRMRSFGS